ncbi:hypothetical protein [Pectobacterium polaris]|uniref:hypothetical protein n=1 Tax=Pectobacterium polaris TaxID=2042057 RepID=UPI002404D977|nr:hypothetical protein [Pectobacterium polaris]MDG0803648.1 hypothetical protein [Pectobacterium polaris]
MNISDFAKKRLEGINWFCCVSQEYSDSFYRVVNLDDFIISIQSDEWENATLEASNEITGFLAKRHSVIYQEWNKLVKEAKFFVENTVIPSVPNVDRVDMKLIFINIKWDLVHYLLEDAYKDKLKQSLFFNELVCVYEHGHIPCGWDGVWPSGNLVIY